MIGESEKTQFRIRPQTPKLDMILLKKAQKKTLSKIEPLPVKATNIKKPRIKVAKKIKIKKRQSINDDEKVHNKHQIIEEIENTEKEIVHTQQNFFVEKLDQTPKEEEVQEEREYKFDQENLEEFEDTGNFFF